MGEVLLTQIFMFSRFYAPTTPPSRKVCFPRTEKPVSGETDIKDVCWVAFMAFIIKLSSQYKPNDKGIRNGGLCF